MITKILKIRALTQLHPGSGTGIGIVDMPIQREKHTHYPLIPGSSIKGVLRDVYQGDINIKEDIFGPDSNDSNKYYSSSASFSDGFIFAYPVRSLKGTFAWITCPEVLRRVNTIGVVKLQNIPNIKDNEIICSNTLVATNNTIILEEYDFVKQDKTIDQTIIDFGKSFFSEDNDKKVFEERFAIVSDDEFTHFVRYSTEITARIALENDTKIVKSGALFYEEFIPAETLFYSLITFYDSRRDNNIKANDLAQNFKIPNIIQLGGDETIGKGICEVNIN